MASNFVVGQRLSYDGIPCTVRYIGAVQGTKGDWLGIEWDYEDRGKHDGEHKGVRYFTPKSPAKTCASFVRPTRKPDPLMTFVDAVYEKYATEHVDRHDALTQQAKEIEISGKTAFEVGFDKIRAQLAELDQLKIVIVDAMRISWSEPDIGWDTPVVENGKRTWHGSAKDFNSEELASYSGRRIRDMCPKIQELDLSRNLFEDVNQILRICKNLDDLRSLRINGNRFSIEPEDFGDATPEEYFSGVEELGIDETLFSWPETCTLLTMFHDLKRLEASKNNYTTLPHSHSLSRYGISPFLLEVKLEYNNFTSFTDILPLSATSSLQSLLLKGNNILKLSAGSGDELPRFGQKLDFVDLSYNQISDWSFIEALPSVFPGLTSLRISHNPVFEIPWTIGGEVQAKVVDEDHMITIARLPKLTTLNFSKITEADRTNAEIFYLSRIARELAALKPEEEAGIIAKHPRYVELCEIHGEPAVPRKKEVMNPNFLEARLIEFTFYMPASTMVSQTEVIEKKRELPKGLDAYRLKGVVGRLFGVRPLRLQLIWETGEWDPVAGFEEKEDDSDDEGVVTEVKANGGGSDERGKYMERLVELEDGTRAIGNIIDGREAKVRVEVIEDTQG